MGSGAVPVQGLFEAHLTVSDLDRSVAFYHDVVGLPVALELPDRQAAFHWIGEPGGAMLTPLSFFGEETDEPSVIGWMPAAAVSFRDPDGHLLEYLTMLDEPARPEVGILPWSEWGGALGAATPGQCSDDQSSVTRGGSSRPWEPRQR